MHAEWCVAGPVGEGWMGMRREMRIMLLGGRWGRSGGEAGGGRGFRSARGG